MRSRQPPPMPAAAVPTAEDMFRIWRADRCVIRFYAARHGLDERAELTLERCPLLRSLVCAASTY
jgi:hypothetical protein